MISRFLIIIAWVYSNAATHEAEICKYLVIVLESWLFIYVLFGVGNYNLPIGLYQKLCFNTFNTPYTIDGIFPHTFIRWFHLLYGPTNVKSKNENDILCRYVDENREDKEIIIWKHLPTTLARLALTTKVHNIITLRTLRNFLYFPQVD